MVVDLSSVSWREKRDRERRFDIREGLRQRRADAGIVIPGCPPAYEGCDASRMHPRCAAEGARRSGIVAASTHRGLRVR